MKMSPGGAERFLAAIAATAQPPVRHQRIHTDTQHPSRSFISLRLEALDHSLGVLVHVPMATGQCLGVPSSLNTPGVLQGSPVPWGECPMMWVSLRQCFWGWRALAASGPRGKDKAGSESAAPKLFL